MLLSLSQSLTGFPFSLYSIVLKLKRIFTVNVQLVDEYKKEKMNIQEEKVLLLQNLRSCFKAVVCVTWPPVNAKLATPSAATCIFRQGHNAQLISQLSSLDKVVL